MSTLTIGRYDHETVTKDYAGWIEPADKTWIIYLDASGRPDIYYPHRDSSGAVTGHAIQL